MQKLQRHYSKTGTITPQTEPIPGSNQIENSAGGYSFGVDDWARLDRFLILGTAGGSYYASEKKLTVENAKAIESLVKADGLRVVNRVTEVSDRGLASKNDYAIYVLAMTSALGNDETRKAAYKALPKVCRTATHLFHFAEYRQAFAGWGRGAKRAVADWYTQKDAEDLAYQIVKYAQRDGWTHQDLLRLAHPKAPTKAHNAIFRYLTGWDQDKVKGRQRHKVNKRDLPKLFTIAEEVKDPKTSKKRVIELIEEYELPREVLPTELLTDKGVWEALLQKMPMTAMIRNLGNMSKVELLRPLGSATKTVVARLGDAEVIRKSRVHPIQVLAALLTYKQGHGMRSESSWKVVPQIVDALDGAFYKAFENVEPTGKRILLALDVSGSMSSGVVGGILGLTPAMASAALAMVTARTEEQYYVMGFADTFKDLKITAKDTLESAMRKTAENNFGGTDCALPMVWARQNKIDVDAFITLTDSETWAGQDGHPPEVLRQYRKATGIQAKNIVVAMVANEFTINDPSDPLGLDVVGFSADTPAAMANFIRE